MDLIRQMKIKFCYYLLRVVKCLV